MARQSERWAPELGQSWAALRDGGANGAIDGLLEDNHAAVLISDTEVIDIT
eukprot:gene20185-2255_t